MDCIYKKSRPVSTLFKIVRSVCEAYRVDESDVLGMSLNSLGIEARGVIATIAKNKTNYSLPTISKILGWGNHNAAIYYMKQVNKKYSKRIMFIERLERAIELIG